MVLPNPRVCKMASVSRGILRKNFKATAAIARAVFPASNTAERLKARFDQNDENNAAANGNGAYISRGDILSTTLSTGAILGTVALTGFVATKAMGGSKSGAGSSDSDAKGDAFEIPDEEIQVLDDIKDPQSEFKLIGEGGMHLVFSPTSEFVDRSTATFCISIVDIDSMP